MFEEHTKFLPLVREKARELLVASPACHDWDHTLRVVGNARHLAEVEAADPTVVEFAALLHDAGRPIELADRGKSCHAAEGERISHELLGELGIHDSHFVGWVGDCVRTHRYRSRNDRVPETIEARVVFDADKLDCIGAVGIGRAFHFAGREGARLHNAEEEAVSSESYSREDTAYREFLVKLRYVDDRMLTEEGRRMAERRHSFMVEFFDRLCRETEGEDYTGRIVS